ncbi:hypothetical protein [Metasolibacillus sp.]|uniref:hypothetical protein n=1 Tax=Metasolibacillus sp. TaxID=2703680 RepID=UPI0025D14B85|nr:hypothetical protein [Metasolibacillus sp.]MCT6925861.1 hypothetical protein [Metasolibacillus sp.]MCT6942018.1 hypothetical protein [Metasolibacillus sp.]
MEAIAQVEVKVDKEYIDSKYEEEFKKQINIKKKLVTIEQLSELYSMKRDALEEAFFNDPRVKIYERRRGKGKRYWIAEKVIPIMDEIIEYEWV